MPFFRIFQHLLPRARAWNLVAEKKLRQLFVGLSKKPEEIREFADLVYYDLFPDTTREIAAWEKQFGLPTASTEQQQRDNVSAHWQSQGGQDREYIEGVLAAAGFDVTLHEWWHTSAGEVLSFDGVDGYVEVSHDADFDVIEWNTSWTISCWFRLEPVNSSEQTIIAKASASGTQQGWWVEVTASGNIQVALVNDWGGGNRVFGASTSFGNLDDDDWHHLVVTYDGSGSRFGLTCWVDNVSSTFSGSGDTISATMATSRDVEIGRRDDTNYWPGTSGGTPVAGYLDEVAIWSGVEMNASQVADLYNSGGVVDYTTLDTADDLVAYWRMGEGASFPNIPDESGNGHSGTMTDMSATDLVERDTLQPGTVPPYVARDPNDYAESALIGTEQCFEEPNNDVQCTDTLDGPPRCNAFPVTEASYLVNKSLGVNIPPPLPTDPDRFPYFIYVGDETFPDKVTIPRSRKDEFERLLLKLCPTQHWIVLRVNYELDFGIFDSTFDDSFE